MQGPGTSGALEKPFLANIGLAYATVSLEDDSLWGDRDWALTKQAVPPFSLVSPGQNLGTPV